MMYLLSKICVDDEDDHLGGRWAIVWVAAFVDLFVGKCVDKESHENDLDGM